MKIKLRVLSLSEIIATAIIVLNLFPELKQITSNYLVLALIGVWFIINLNKIQSSAPRNWMLLFVLWLLISGVLSVVTGNTRILNTYVFELLNLLFPFILYCCIKDDCDCISFYTKEITFLLTVLAAYRLVFVITNRAINMYSVRSEFTYASVYTLVLFTLAIVANLLMNNREKYHSIIALIGAVLASTLIIYANFLIAVVLLILGILMCFTFKYGRSKTQIVVLLLIEIIAGIVIVVNLQNILMFIYNSISNDLYRNRIYDLIHLNSSSGSNTAAARIDVYTISIDSFLNHPFWGTIFSLSDQKVVYDYIGYHSTVLDNLALFGLWGIIPIYLMISPMVYAIKNKRHHISIILPVTIVFVCLLFIDNQIPSLGILLYLFTNMISSIKKQSSNPLDGSLS